MLCLRFLVALALAHQVLCVNVTGDSEGQLVTVVVIFRHGDRVIIKPYPNDPYKNNSLWPVGWGQLTNEGKLEQLELGQWLRDRYSTFLPNEYSEKDIYIRSTDVDRTLMSAEANLAGLYPPQGPQIWDRNIPWQPIPIHTRPEKQDAILAMKKPCPMYDVLLEKLMKSPEIEAINKKNRDLYEYIAENAGENITDFDSLEYIYNNLVIEAKYNFTLPPWTKTVFPERMKPLAEFSFAIPCYTPQLARLRTGPFFHELLGHLANVTDSLKQGKKQHRKLWMYSGHDTTIANVLQALGLFEYHCPPYTSTILFEMRRANDDFYVNVFYKNTSEPQPMTLKGCEFNCPVGTFAVLLEHINLSIDQWEEECELPLTSFMEFVDTNEIVLAVGGFLLALVLIGVVTKVLCSKWRKSSMIYLRLPDDDEQV